MFVAPLFLAQFIVRRQQYTTRHDHILDYSVYCGGGRARDAAGVEDTAYVGVWGCEDVGVAAGIAAPHV